MRRDLVLARVGRNSLHPTWLEGGRRDWDLHLVPFQELDPAALEGCTTSEVVVGPKWTGLREALITWEGWREYDQVWLPDDDIATDAATITELFRIGRELGLDLFAPALDESSYFAHFDTIVNRRFHGRWVGFVEIMVPAFSVAALERLLPTLDETPTGWGWGLDSLWPKLLGYEKVAIIDATTVTHTRPVGEMRDADLARRVRAESDAIFAKYDCRQIHTTFGAFGPDLELLPLDPAALLLEVVRGYEALIERDPRLLAWICAFQEPGRGWPGYPVEGTPGS
jgi:hypothetical protein